MWNRVRLPIEWFFNEIKRCKKLWINYSCLFVLYSANDEPQNKNRDIETKKRFIFRACHLVHVIFRVLRAGHIPLVAVELKTRTNSRQLDSRVSRKIQLGEGNHSYTLIFSISLISAVCFNILVVYSFWKMFYVFPFFFLISYHGQVGKILSMVHAFLFAHILVHLYKIHI